VVRVPAVAALPARVALVVADSAADLAVAPAGAALVAVDAAALTPVSARRRSSWKRAAPCSPK